MSLTYFCFVLDKGSDEPDDCPKYICTPGQFQCNNTHCIFPAKICDGQDDCKDGSDEHFCDDYVCLPEQFKCSGLNQGSNNRTSQGFCIPMEKRCNKKQDCPNGEDEADCPPTKCQDDDFKCGNNKCVPRVWECDGDNDCGDNTDEPEDCPTRNCTQVGHFKCPSTGRCIPPSWKCDGDSDCENGEDEGEEGQCNDPSQNPCEDSYFRCTNGKCIPGKHYYHYYIMEC